MSDDNTAWGIDVYWDFTISGPQCTALAYELEKLDTYKKVKMSYTRPVPAPDRFKVSIERICSYGEAVVSVPRDVVQAAHNLNIPMANDMLIAIVVKELGKNVL